VLLEDKNAVIYGGGGSIGAAVARSSPARGQRSSRRPHPVEARGSGRRDPLRGGSSRDGASECARREGGRRACRCCGGGGRRYRHLLQPGHASNCARNAAGRDVARGLRPAGRDRREDDVPDLAGGRPPHGQAGIGRDPGVRRLGRPDARLLPGRHPGRIRGDRIHAAAAVRRARSARRACRDPAKRAACPSRSPRASTGASRSSKESRS